MSEPSNRDEHSPETASEPGSRAAAGQPAPDFEQAAAAGKLERRQLLNHLIAKDDEISGYQRELQALRAERDGLKTHLAQLDGQIHALSTRLRPSAQRTRALMVAAAVVAACAVSVGLFHLFVNRPMRTALSERVAALDGSLEREKAENQQLRSELSVKNQAVNATARDLTVDSAVGQTSKGDNPAAERKAFADKTLALDAESRRLEQVGRDLAAENQRLVDRKKRLDEAQAVSPPERKAAAPAAPIPVTASSGVLMWRADVTSKTAVMITGNTSNYGAVSGGLPGKSATIKLQVLEGNVKVIEEPGSRNNWNRLYFQVNEKGPTVVFVMWVLAAQ